MHGFIANAINSNVYTMCSGQWRGHFFCIFNLGSFVVLKLEKNVGILLLHAIKCCKKPRLIYNKKSANFLLTNKYLNGQQPRMR